MTSFTAIPSLKNYISRFSSKPWKRVISQGYVSCVQTEILLFQNLIHFVPFLTPYDCLLRLIHAHIHKNVEDLLILK